MVGGVGAGPVDVPLQADLEGLVVVALFFLVGLFFVYDGFNTWQRMRLMQDTPTERVRSAAVGRTELNGTGRPIGDPLRRPFDDGTCLVATWEIEEWEEDHDDDHGSNGHWSTVDSGTLVEPFQFDDGTGTMRVEPDTEATFRFRDEHETRIRVRPNQQEPPEVEDFLRNHSDADVPAKGGVTGFLFSEDRRYTQRYVPVGTDLYLLGATEPVEPDEHNSSGLVLRRDTASDEFVISALAEDELVASSKWMAPAKIVGGLGLSAVTLYFLLGMLGVA